MRSFSYVLAACVVTALALATVPRLLSQPIARMVQRCIEALPLCAMVVVTDRDGVIFEQLVGATEVAGPAGYRSRSRIEVASISRRFTFVAVAVVADRGSPPIWQLLRSDHRRGRFAIGVVSASVPRPPRA